MLPFRVTSCNLFDKKRTFPASCLRPGRSSTRGGADGFRSFVTFELSSFFFARLSLLRYVRAFEFSLCPVFARSSAFVGSLFRSSSIWRFAFDVAGAFGGLRFVGFANRVKIGASGSCSSFARLPWNVYFAPIVFVASLAFFALFASFAAIGASTVSASSLCSGERRRFSNLRTGQKGKAFAVRTLRKPPSGKTSSGANRAKKNVAKEKNRPPEPINV